MADIALGRIGRIAWSPRGLSIGWFVKVEPEGSGFLILTFEDRTMRGPVYDDFAVDEDELHQRLRDWRVDWDPSGPAQVDERSSGDAGGLTSRCSGPAGEVS